MGHQVLENLNCSDTLSRLWHKPEFLIRGIVILQKHLAVKFNELESILQLLMAQTSFFGDEPTSALNSKTTLEILKILRRVNEKGKTLAVVTHDGKVAACAERVLFMLDGEL